MKLIIDIPDYAYALFAKEHRGEIFIRKKDMVEWIKNGRPYKDYKTGKWYEVYRKGSTHGYMCSICHKVIECGKTANEVSIDYPYCCCGADMRGEE